MVFVSLKSFYIDVLNPIHNILELYNVLVQIQLVTCKLNLDIYLIKLGIRIAVRVAKHVKLSDSTWFKP